MAKEVAIGKRAKISQAQQYMLLAVLGASIFLGAAISLTLHFVNQISFNTKVIMAAEESIANYSNVIKTTGVCKAPSGSVYSDDELNKCDPSSIEISEIPGTLRANILENLAANTALNSVPKEDDSACINPDTSKNYTYKELNKIYSDARGASELQAAANFIKRCSALRVIPDALPSYKNEEALLASLNKLFILSDWEPESIAPDDSVDDTIEYTNVNPISLSFKVDANTGTVTKVMNSIERSIREFDIRQFSLEWAGSDSLTFQTKATAYYVDESNVAKSTKTITAEGK